MPLLDHFHPPLSLQRHWESFHTTWAGSLADALNEDWLPDGYFAEEQVTAGGRIEIDVATFSESGEESPSDSGAIATQRVRSWTAPAPTLSFPLVVPDEFRVLVYRSEGGPKLVAAVELVSPANKDRPESRRAFVTKCAAALHQRISLVVVDIVTSRTANLHYELLGLLQVPNPFAADPLSAAAYRTSVRSEPPSAESWYEPLEIGARLPTLPLYLDEETAIPLDLEVAYTTALQRRRMPG